LAEITEYFGQTLTILLMALALGMDAFSLSLGIGMRGIRLMSIAKISAAIALFHVFMPLAGFFTGKYVSALLGDLAVMIGGGLLIALGGHMIYSSIRGDAVQSIDLGSVFGLLAFAMSVSVDSLSVGVSLGMFASDLVMTVMLNWLFGGLMTATGLIIGRGVGQMVGDYGEALGGAILLAFGILFLI
jgi:putative Mn2+ efflux pump MntP